MGKVRRVKGISPNNEERYIAENLRKFRNKLGLSQEEFGDLFGGFTKRQVNSYESGEVEIPIRLLVELKRKGFPPEIILGSEKPMDMAIVEAMDRLRSCEMICEKMKKMTKGFMAHIEQSKKEIAKALQCMGVRKKDDGRAGEKDKKAERTQIEHGGKRKANREDFLGAHLQKTLDS